MSEELKPCPFCGSEKIAVHYSNEAFVYCKMCGAQAGDTNEHYSEVDSRSREIAIENWNNRPETAWEIMQKVLSKLSFSKWHDYLPEKYHSIYLDRLSFIRFLGMCPEQEAIKIMQEIEQELNK